MNTTINEGNTTGKKETASKPAAATSSEENAPETSAEAEAEQPEVVDASPKPVQDLTPAEIEAYYEKNNLEIKSQGAMTEYDLDIVERRGAILSQRREQAEMEGERATLTKVRRMVQKYTEVYGRAQFLTQLLSDNYARLTREDVEPKVTITIQSGGVAVEFGFEDIQQAYNQKNNSVMVDFNRQMNTLLSVIKSTANQRKIKESRVNGRDYTAMCSDITWRAVVDQLAQEHAE